MHKSDPRRQDRRRFNDVHCCKQHDRGISEHIHWLMGNRGNHKYSNTRILLSTLIVHKLEYIYIRLGIHITQHREQSLLLDILLGW